MGMKMPEILAPAGRWDVLTAVVAAGADAVYLGGKRGNMRLHQRDWNFSDEELARAADFCRDRNVRLYVTLNNLQTADEIDAGDEYLSFLASIKPSALIVQDLGLLAKIGRMGLDTELHVSTMMNIHNPQTLRLLRAHGVKRVVLSKDLSLKDVRRLVDETGFELEYFVHGDTCIAQHGSCTQSGIVFGAGSGRGRCYKMCRWDYELVDGKDGRPLATLSDGSYLLAHKDLCLLTHIPDVVAAGVSALKIEGRMRPAEHVARIVRLYRRAVNAYRDDPSGYLFDGDDASAIVRESVRDLTTGAAFHKVGLESVGATGEREPKIFSRPVMEKRLDYRDIVNDRHARAFPHDDGNIVPHATPKLTVRVRDAGSAIAAMEAGADVIYIGGDVSVSRGTPWSVRDIVDCIDEGRRRKRRVLVSSPSYMMWRETEEWRALVVRLMRHPPDGWLIADFAALEAVRGFAENPFIAGDLTFNIANHESVEFMRGEGFRMAALSPELSFLQAREIARRAETPVEVLAHGPVTAMKLDHCLIASLLLNKSPDDVCPAPCRTATFALRDGAGEVHAIEPDQYCRNHLLLATDVCAFPYIGAFLSAGFGALRIDARCEDAERIRTIVDLYRRGIDDPSIAADENGWKILTSASAHPLGLGAFPRGLTEEEILLVRSAVE